MKAADAGKRLIDKLTDESCSPLITLHDALQPMLKNALRGKLRLYIPSASPSIRPDGGRHFHMMPEFFFQFSGSTEFNFIDGLFTLHAGEMLLMPRRVAHSEKALNQPGSFCNFILMLHQGDLSGHFAISRDGSPAPCRPCPELQGFSFSLVMDIVESLLQAEKASTLTGRALQQGALLSLLGRLASFSHTTVAEMVDSKVAQCRQLVQVQLVNHDLNVNRLAEWLNCAPSYLSHRFHQETGQTLSSYITALRIEYAERLLMSTTLTIQEIAWTCGFVNPAYFSRVFRQTCGMSARNYRNKTFSE